jgi:hypothetical protein
MDKLAKSVIYVDDTALIIANSNPEEFKENFSSLIINITNWFQSNLLTLNGNKTHFMQFLINKQNERIIQINAPNSLNTNINSTKFLGLTLDVSLSWKNHIATLTSKSNKACYAIRSMKPLLSTDILLTHLCLMGSFLGAIHTPTKIFSKSRKELLELLQILVIMSLAVKHLKSYKYSHYHCNSFFPC